jgi:hypothetical protein
MITSYMNTQCSTDDLVKGCILVLRLNYRAYKQEWVWLDCVLYQAVEMSSTLDAGRARHAYIAHASTNVQPAVKFCELSSHA